MRPSMNATTAETPAMITAKPDAAHPWMLGDEWKDVLWRSSCGSLVRHPRDLWAIVSRVAIGTPPADWPLTRRNV